MENVIAIGVGLALRAVIDILTDSDYRLTGTLVGLWEGFALSHFLQKNPRNPSDAYLALATRFAIDFMITNSIVRFFLTGAWTIVGLLLAEIAPSVLRETGLRHVYRALRKDFKAMRRAMPRWRIENDIRVPNISISNPVPGLFSRPPASTVASSTRAVPPASPAPILQRRSRSAPGQATPSETNTLTREVLPGPSPALIHIDVDPGFPPFDPDPHSHRSSYLSNSSDSDPSRHDPIQIPDDDRAHNTVPSHAQEQVQEQGPDLSVLNLTPPVATIEVTTSSAEIVSPTPRARIGALPTITDFEINRSVHAPSVPPSESRPASRVRNLLSTIGVGIFSQTARAHFGEVVSDRGPDVGQVHAPFHQQASSVGVLEQAQNQPTSGNQLNSTEEHSSSKWPHSRLRHPEDTIVPDGAARAENFVGGFVIQAGRQMPQLSGTPQAQSGSGGVHASSALGLSTLLPSSNMPAAPPNPAPQTKPPTPTPASQARQTNQTSHPRSGTPAPTSHTPASALPPKIPTPAPALPPKTPTPAPPSRAPTPIQPSTSQRKSRAISPDLTSTSMRNPTDYDPSDPVRPMPGLKSPSTEHDPIVPDVRARGPSATTNFNLLDTADDYDPPPPFKEFESPVHPRGADFGAGVNYGKGLGGEQVVEGSGSGVVTEPAAAKGGAEGDEPKELAKEEAGKANVNKNIDEVDAVGGGDAGGGTNETIETSQDSGNHVRSADPPKQEESAQKKVKDGQEQEKSIQDGDGNQEAVNDSQATCEGAKIASGDNGDTQDAGGNTQDADTAPKPEPTRLTPEQKEAETHRTAFLSKEVARLEESRKKMKSSDNQGLSEIKARLSVMKERISKTDFADPPKDPPPAPELATSGKPINEICSMLTKIIVELLLERKDAGPIDVTVSYSKGKRSQVLELLKGFTDENNFRSSDPGPLSIVITM